MMNGSARNGRSASQPTGLRRIRASFARETEANAPRPASRVSRPHMARRVDDSAPTLIDMEPVPAASGLSSLPPATAVSLVFEGEGWGMHLYDPANWSATVPGASATTLVLAKPGASESQNAPAKAPGPDDFDGSRWITLDPRLRWAALHDATSDAEWPDIPAADVEQTREMAAVRDDRPLTELEALEARTRQTLGRVDVHHAAWANHLSDPDAMGERADARTTSLHARWLNLGVVDGARVQAAADGAEPGDYVAAELTRAIVGRAIALDADLAQINEAIGAAA